MRHFRLFLTNRILGFFIFVLEKLTKKLSNDTQPHFQLTKEAFRRDFLPIYSGYGIELAEDAILFQLTFPLPYQLPVIDGRTFTSVDADNNVLSIVIREHYRPQTIDNLIPTTSTKMLKYSYIETLSVYTSDVKWEDLLEEIINNINILVRSYSSVTKDFDVHPINLRMLGAFALSRKIRISDWNEDIFFHMLPNLDRIPYSKECITPEQDAKMGRMIAVDAFSINPFTSIYEIYKSAIREHKNGKYTESILLLQTSFEVLVKEIVATIYSEEGKTDVQIDRILQTGYKNIRNDHLFKKLQIRSNQPWDEKYMTYVYKLRNDIAHAGYLPNRKEVERAFVHAEIYLSYLTKKIHRTDYRRIKKLLAKKK